MQAKSHIGIDLGGTNLRAGLVRDHQLQKIVSARINAQATAEEVLGQIIQLTDGLLDSSVASIGIGVPGLVDEEKGTVYDVVNIPSWQEVPLQRWMQQRYPIPVLLNNDANCFALGEFYFGKGKGSCSLVGLTIGTGLGAGIILNKKLYAGATGGAGEFGMIDYLDRCYEYYASGQFFTNVYGMDGEEVYRLANEGNQDAVNLYAEMGGHLGNAIKAILYALDVDLIVLGGSVRLAYPWFQKSMWESIQSMAYQRAVKNLRIEVSELPNSGLLGAAVLYEDAQLKKTA